MTRELCYDEDGLDDIVVKNVQMFRMERMGRNEWWIGLYLGDDDDERVTFWLKASRKDGLTATVTEGSELCEEIARTTVSEDA